MTFNNEIEELKAQIKVLEKKVVFLEEIEKQPRMNLQQEGEYAVVSYHDKVYYRLEGEFTFSWYIKKGVSANYPVPTLVMVNDAETERLLEGLYYNHIQVKKEKEQRTKTPVEECYKDWWGQYPETGTWDSFDEKRWQGFQAGYEFAYAISTAKEVMEKVQEEQKWDAVRESVKWCEEHRGESLEDYLTPQTPKEQEPEMLLLRQGKVDIVDYNHRTHYRIEYTDSFSGVYKWFVRKLGEVAFLEEIRDVNNYAPLEELYQKEVMKQKEEYPYKKYTPEETEQSLKEAFVKAQQTEEWKETQRKIDAPKESWMNKSDEELVAILKKNLPDCLRFELSPSLEDRIYKWWETCFVHHPEWSMEECVEDLLDIIELYLPRFQSASGSQSLGVEDMVEGFNDCLKKIKSKLRNKKDT
jgi:hypothetical protein